MAKAKTRFGRAGGVEPQTPNHVHVVVLCLGCKRFKYSG